MFDPSEVLDVIGCRENLAWCRVPDSESQVKIQESIKGKYASISSKVTIYWREVFSSCRHRRKLTLAAKKS
jgi:hypothetical protein